MGMQWRGWSLQTNCHPQAINTRLKPNTQTLIVIISIIKGDTFKFLSSWICTNIVSISSVSSVGVFQWPEQAPLLQVNTGLWLVDTDHVTSILASDLLICPSEPPVQVAGRAHGQHPEEAQGPRDLQGAGGGGQGELGRWEQWPYTAINPCLLLLATNWFY